MTEIITDCELARRVGNGERPRVVKVGTDRWRVAPRHAIEARQGHDNEDWRDAKHESAVTVATSDGQTPIS